LQNLVDNALQAKGRGCQLTLALLLGEERSCDIVLTDNGPGIPQELQERVFEPFFTNRANGTGLGLAVVQAIAKAHEGAVWVDSQPGEGCRFSLRLPLAPSAAGGRRKRSLGRLR
jgi:two-component system sensor histidine kinase FlrB